MGRMGSPSPSHGSALVVALLVLGAPRLVPCVVPPPPFCPSDRGGDPLRRRRHWSRPLLRPSGGGADEPGLRRCPQGCEGGGERRGRMGNTAGRGPTSTPGSNRPHHRAFCPQLRGRLRHQTREDSDGTPARCVAPRKCAPAQGPHVWRNKSQPGKTTTVDDDGRFWRTRSCCIAGIGLDKTRAHRGSSDPNQPSHIYRRAT